MIILYLIVIVVSTLVLCDDVYVAGNAFDIEIPIEIRNDVNGLTKIENFKFHQRETDLENIAKQFCDQHLIYETMCISLYEAAVAKQIEYLEANVQAKSRTQCEQLPEGNDCVIQTQYIANPHLHRVVHALSAEINSQHKSTEKISSMITRENEVVTQITTDLQSIFHTKSDQKEEYSKNKQADRSSQLAQRTPQIIFIHSCSIPNEHNRILDEILTQIIEHGLIDTLDRVYVLNYGLDITEEVIQKYTSRTRNFNSGGIDTDTNETTTNDSSDDNNNAHLNNMYRDKIKFIQVSTDTSHFEIPTLRIMHRVVKQLYMQQQSVHLTPRMQNSSHEPLQHSDTATNTVNNTMLNTKHHQRRDNTNNMHILYLHTKGVSYSQSYPQITDWRRYMLYFLVERHRDCYHLLASGQFDAVGVNYKSMPRDFRGNYWWTTSHYLNALPDLSIYTSGKYEAEQWLLNSNLQSNHRVRVVSLHESGIDHHFTMYSRDKYVVSEDIISAKSDYKDSNSDVSYSDDRRGRRQLSSICFAKSLIWKQ